MANIFLSYDREDEPRARPLAALLERSGHSVWWDRHIKGGREFASEIEAALDAADKILVLWSAQAIKSPWVRDEASVGRDSGRLVPATLDGTLPPLGFRQFHTINLSKVKWRGRSPQLEQLLEALASLSPLELGASGQQPKTLLSYRPMLSKVAVLALLVAMLGAVVWWWTLPSAPERPQIAIRAADQSALSRQAARDLVLKVPELPGADASAFDLVDTAHKSSKANFVLEVGAAGGQRERRDMVLRASDGTILWSSTIERPVADAATLPQELTVQAQRALSCAADALAYRHGALKADTLKLYLTACTGFENAFAGATDNSEQIRLLEQVVDEAPDFEPAWAKLLINEVHAIDGAPDRQALLRKIDAQVRHAQKRGLDFGELYVARAFLPQPTDFLGRFRILEEGLDRHPGNAAVLRAWAERSWFVGRMSDAVGASAEAVRFDPMSIANRQTLIVAHAYAGNIDAAYAELRKAEQLWPSSLTIKGARYGLDLRFGDPARALELLQSSIEMSGLQSQQMMFLKARIDPTPANIERAIAEDRMLYEQQPDYFSQIVQTLAQFGRKDDVLDILLNYRGGYVGGLETGVLFRPAFRELWRDPRSMAAAAHLGLLYYWKTGDRWPDFCSDPKLPYDCKKEAAKYRVQKFSVTPRKR